MHAAHPIPKLRTLAWAIALPAITCAISPAWGQGAGTAGDNAHPLPAGQIKGLTPVDAGRPDMSPFSLSFRRLQMDLRLPLGFDQVYQIDPAPPLLGAVGRPTGAPRFARRSGALTAVFPRSEYQSTEDGVKVIVPADTRFHIGPMDGGLTPAAPAPTGPSSWHGASTVASMIADHSVDRGVRRAGPGPQAAVSVAMPPAPVPPAPPSPPIAAQAATREGMMTSEVYRVRRLTSLLNEAARAAELEPKP